MVAVQAAPEALEAAVVAGAEVQPTFAEAAPRLPTAS
jgi:hypothetical protein